MWFTLSPAKIVKHQHANHASQHQQPTGPAKINALFLSPHLRFLRQMLLPNMRPVRNKRSCAKPPTHRQQWKNAIAKSVLILACGSYGLVASANDSSREGSTIYSFNIPAVKVEQALSQLAETTGHQLLFSYALVNSLQSTAVKGDHTAPNALQLILQNTPLTARFTERGVIVITDASAGDNTDKGRGNMNSKTTLTKRKNVLAAMVGLFAAAGGASSAMAQGDEAATAQGRIDELRRVRKTLPEQSVEQPRLEPHHRQILDYIKEHGSITQREYGTISSRSLASRKLDFNKLLKLGLIKVESTGRGTYYVLAS